MACGVSGTVGVTAASAKTACTEVAFIGAAGSGELEKKAKPSPASTHDLGREVQFMSTVVEREVKAEGMSFSAAGVKYKAASVSTLVPSHLALAALIASGPVAGLATYEATYVANYEASITGGVATMKKRAESVIRKCPATQLILAGYSQGAIVAHDTELQLSQDTLNHVAGTLLLADGDRAPDTAARIFGGASEGGEGIRPYLKRTGKTDVPLPDTTAEICIEGDIVCSFDWEHLIEAEPGAYIHTHYREDDELLLEEAAEWVTSFLQPPGSSGGASAATDLSIGGAHSCAVLETATLSCWGQSQDGEFGNGQTLGPEFCEGTPCSRSPVAATTLRDVKQVSAGGGAETCAVRTAGTVYCWGEGGFGQLGNGFMEDMEPCNGAGSGCENYPVRVKNISDASEVAVGEQFACAVLKTGGVDCWGLGNEGQLGVGPVPEGGFENAYPEAVLGISDAVEVSANYYDACARLATGHVLCWGLSGAGQLGDGQSTGPAKCSGNACAPSPVEVESVSTAQQISVGDGHSCAVLSRGRVMCWGTNQSGDLGDGEWEGPESCAGVNECSQAPVEVPGITTATEVAAGWGGACAVLSDGEVDCWGSNEFGELGVGLSSGPETCRVDLQCSTRALTVHGLAKARTISASPRFSYCSLSGEGAASCWGANEAGQLGDGTTTNRDIPVSVSGL